MTRVLTTALLVLALLAVGCGGDDEPKIPRQQAADLRAELLEAKRRLSPLRCDDLETDSLRKLTRRVAALEDGDVKDTLKGALEHLRSLVEADCAAREEEPEETTTETTETTTEPPTTTPQPPETTETQPEPEPDPGPAPDPDPNPDPDPDPGGNDENGNGGQGVPQGAVKPKNTKKGDG